MEYERHEWYNGEVIVEELLNNMEAGIEANNAALATKINIAALDDITDEDIDAMFEDEEDEEEEDGSDG